MSPSASVITATDCDGGVSVSVDAIAQRCESRRRHRTPKVCASAVARHMRKRRTLLRLLVQTGRLQRGEETLGQRTELLDGRRVENEIGVGGSKHRGDVVLRGLHAPVDVDGLQNDARVHNGPVRFCSPLTDRDLEFSERERGFLIRLLRGVLELRARSSFEAHTRRFLARCPRRQPRFSAWSRICGSRSTTLLAS